MPTDLAVHTVSGMAIPEDPPGKVSPLLTWTKTNQDQLEPLNYSLLENELIFIVIDSRAIIPNLSIAR